ncbi:MAG: hemin ABC transporter substrate-binding protein [Halothiobacillaceae bacterium]
MNGSVPGSGGPAAVVRDLWLTVFAVAVLLLVVAGGLTCRAEASAGVPERVIGVGGPVTELIYALGAEDRLVGTDTSSVYPPEADALPKVGYQRQLSVEGTLSLSPDLVVGTAGMGPPEAVAQLRRVDLPLEIMPEVQDADSAARRILVLGELLGAETQAASLAQAYRAHLDEVLAPDHPRVRSTRVAMFFSHGGGNAMALGRGTLGNSVLEMLGVQNVFSDIEGTRPVSSEAVIAAKPDLVLLSTQAVDASGGLSAAIEAIPGLAQTEAARSGRVVVYDLLALLGFGPRQPEVLEQIMAAVMDREHD